MNQKPRKQLAVKKRKKKLTKHRKKTILFSVATYTDLSGKSRIKEHKSFRYKISSRLESRILAVTEIETLAPFKKFDAFYGTEMGIQYEINII